MYAVMRRNSICIHLQRHDDTKDDPLLGGSVIKNFVDDIRPIYQEFVDQITITKYKLRENSPW